MMAKFCNMIHGLKPIIIMVMVQLSLAGVNVCYKLASNDGMSMPVMVAYRFLFAAATVAPLALYVERNIRPKLTWMVVFQAFLCGLFGGSVTQNLYAQCLVMTSATFASAMTNLIPALTFILAVFFGLEKLQLKSMAGKAKVIGTLMCMAGAMVLTFYKGVEIKIGLQSLDLLKHNQKDHQVGHLANSHQSDSIHHNIIVGPMLAFLACLFCAVGLIFQAKMSHRYPCHYSSTALISLMGSFQAFVIALCLERDWSQWKLGRNIRLLSAAYSGIVASGIMIVFSMWCVRMRGPVFVSAFTPLMLVVVVIAGVLFLNEKLHLGSILGAVVIICGLYSVLLGKKKEMKRITQLMPSNSFEEEFDDQQQHETNKDNIKTINVMGVAPTLLLTPDVDVSETDRTAEEDPEMGISNDSNTAKV